MTCWHALQYLPTDRELIPHHARPAITVLQVWTWPHSSPPSRIHRTIDSMPGEAAHHRPWAFSTREPTSRLQLNPVDPAVHVISIHRCHRHATAIIMQQPFPMKVRAPVKPTLDLPKCNMMCWQHLSACAHRQLCVLLRVARSSSHCTQAFVICK